MITIRDIAERLELSVSTVGRALADHLRISREIRERVRSMAEEFACIANEAASSARVGVADMHWGMAMEGRSPV